jgi:hypothetical protein
MKHFGAGILAGLLALAPLQAQELWDSSFNLSAGMASGAKEAFAGQDKAYGLSIMGAYPLGRRGSAVFEFGYRYLPSTTTVDGYVVQNLRSDGFLGGALYRHELLFEGFYLQGGLRASQMKTLRTTTFGVLGQTDDKGPRAVAVRPVLGVGFRFDNLLSLELNAGSLGLKTMTGADKSATLVELSLGIHLGN